MSNEDEPERKQEREWEELYHLIRMTLQPFGTEDVLPSADCWVHDDNWGGLQQKIYVRNLNLLSPNVITMLRALLSDYPDWEIVVAVSVPDQVWPDMGLTIRKHEIIDGLQRQYFPSPFRNFFYDHARPGTEND